MSSAPSKYQTGHTVPADTQIKHVTLVLAQLQLDQGRCVLLTESVLIKNKTTTNTGFI